MKGKFLDLIDLKFLIKGPFIYLLSNDYFYIAKEKGGYAGIEQELNLLKSLNYYPEGNDQKLSLEINIGVLGLTLTTNCNLKCSYCCARNYMERMPSRDMSIDTVKKAIDFFVRNTSYNSLYVVFYGGEPLINWEALRLGIEYAKSSYPDKRWHFILETNGTLLDEEKASFLSSPDIFILFSLSSRDIQDKFRPDIFGQGSYDAGLRGLKLLLSCSAKVHVRSILPQLDINVEEERQRLRQEIGSDVSISVIYEKALFSRCISEGVVLQSLRDIKEMNVLELMPAIRLILEPYLCKPADCAGGVEGYLVGVDGKVTVCQETLEDPRYDLGSLDNFDSYKALKVKERFLQAAKSCRDCEISAFCAYCPLLKDKGVSPSANYCSYAKSLFQEALRRVASMGREDIIQLYEFYSSPSALKKLEKALYIRELIWLSNKHIKPLFIFPISKEKINPWGLLTW